MNAGPDCRFAIASRFHVPPDWSRRLALGAPWRTPTEAERAGLVRAAAVAANGPNEDVLLFGLPRHLLAEWQELLERAATSAAGALDGFDAYAGRVGAFLAFKGLPVPAEATCEVLASASGQESVSWDGANASARLWGGVNLGDEAAAVVFADLPHQDAPPVRLLLGPGEGFRLPERGPLVRGCTLNMQEPSLLLLIRRAVGPAPRR
jgi:hypothetical protein